MKTLKNIAVFILTFLAINSFSQNVEFDKDNFKNDKDGFKKAMGNLKQGDEYYEMQSRGAYILALDFYLEANRFNPNSAKLNYKIGRCYEGSMQKSKCLEYFKKAQSLGTGEIDIKYYIARGHHLNLEFDEAMENYKAYKNVLSPKELQEKRKNIDKKIQECKNGKILVQNPVRVFIDNLGGTVNSIYPDYSPLISADESMMIFTSRRADTYGGGSDPGDQQYFEDIYVTYNIDGIWQTPKNMGKPLNTSNNDATVGLSPDGQQLFIFNGKEGGGNILMCELKGEEWSKPDDGTLKKYINTDYHESSASFSFDGKTMYFVSNRPDMSFGNHDIYYTKWDEEKERWGEPVNIGSTINTEYEEEGVLMHPDGRTIYFSSQGHNSMGGYDIFKSEMDDNGNWGTPINLGYPINTPDDDVFFVINASGKRGYYSSAQDGGNGSYDIYVITFLGPEKPLVQSNEDNLIASIANPISETVIEESVEIKTTRLTILKGTITDGFTGTPIGASIEIVDNEKNQVISVSSSNSSTGKYLVSLPSGKNYGIAVKATDYLFHSENFNIPAATNYQEIVKDIQLNKMKIGSSVILKNVFFDYAKATLRPESYPELDRLYKLMADFPKAKIKVTGHTDSRGSVTTNTRLSNDRAQAVVQYLIDKGIDKGRLQFEGMAAQKPIVPNAKTEDQHQQNRRVEFEIIE
ncbi:MAG: OmpA family protein [Bacteroidales bacterium]|nr:OmpA family protein [Bacteroidales bacterium]